MTTTELSVRARKQHARARADDVALSWLTERCRLDEHACDWAAVLVADWHAWAAANGWPRPTGPQIGRVLLALGCAQRGSGDTAQWLGVALRSPGEPDSAMAAHGTADAQMATLLGRRWTLAPHRTRLRTRPRRPVSRPQSRPEQGTSATCA